MAFVLPQSTRKFAFNRADHVGSFLRPPVVHESRKAFKEKTLDAAGLRKVEDAEISTLVGEQRTVGIKSISDGEFRCVASPLKESSGSYRK
jgi:5-methyltetrahydropteroyltriglutamate--homocysteine methyltransferase